MKTCYKKVRTTTKRATMPWSMAKEESCTKAFRKEGFLKMPKVGRADLARLVRALSMMHRHRQKRSRKKP